MAAIAAAILAGGRAERLGGVNKALLEVGGIRLIDRVLGAIGEAEPILLCVGATVFLAALPVPRRWQIPDLPTAYRGPLAGVVAAVEALLADAAPDYLLTVAVDTPFFPADFIERALPLVAGAPAAIGAWSGQDYPTNGLWRFEALRELPRQTRAAAAPHSLKRLAERLGAVRLDYAGHPGGNPFANANTPDDLLALDRRARGASAVFRSP